MTFQEDGDSLLIGLLLDNLLADESKCISGTITCLLRFTKTLARVLFYIKHDNIKMNCFLININLYYQMKVSIIFIFTVDTITDVPP